MRDATQTPGAAGSALGDGEVPFVPAVRPADPAAAPAPTVPPAGGANRLPFLLVTVAVAGLVVLSYRARNETEPADASTATPASVSTSTSTPGSTSSPTTPTTAGGRPEPVPASVGGTDGTRSVLSTSSSRPITTRSGSSTSSVSSSQTTPRPPTSASTTTSAPSTGPPTTARTTTTARRTTTEAPTTVRETTTRPTTTTTRPTTTALGVNLIENGGFEVSGLGSGYANVDLDPWRSSAGRVEVWGSGHDDVESAAGVSHAELNVDDRTTYTQTVSTRGGTSYRWSLKHRGRNDVDTMEVLVAGVVVQRVSSDQRWIRYEGTFVATSSTTDFGLRSVDGGGAANLLDQVQVREIIR